MPAFRARLQSSGTHADDDASLPHDPSRPLQDLQEVEIRYDKHASSVARY